MAKNEIARFIEIHNEIAERNFAKGQREAWHNIDKDENYNNIIEIAKTEMPERAREKIKMIIRYFIFEE